MSRRSNHVRVDSRHPQAQGVCDRCGFRYQLRDLADQHEWAGSGLINRQIKVCETCLDEPNESLRVYTPGPDPLPVSDPRPETADMD